jgi:hypothetical protein
MVFCVEPNFSFIVFAIPLHVSKSSRILKKLAASFSTLLQHLNTLVRHLYNARHLRDEWNILRVGGRCSRETSGSELTFCVGFIAVCLIKILSFAEITAVLYCGAGFTEYLTNLEE